MMPHRRDKFTVREKALCQSLRSGQSLRTERARKLIIMNPSIRVVEFQLSLIENRENFQVECLDELLPKNLQIAQTNHCASELQALAHRHIEVQPLHYHAVNRRTLSNRTQPSSTFFLNYILRIVEVFLTNRWVNRSIFLVSVAASVLRECTKSRNSRTLSQSTCNCFTDSTLLEASEVRSVIQTLAAPFAQKPGFILGSGISNTLSVRMIIDRAMCRKTDIIYLFIA